MFYINRHDCIAPIDRAIRCSFTAKAGALRKATIESLIKSTVRRPKTGPGLSLDIQYSCIHYLLSEGQSGTRVVTKKERVNRPEHSTVLFQSHAGILDYGKRPLSKQNKAIPLWEID